MKRLHIFMPSLAFLLIIAILTGMFFLLPKSTFSENEKRLLADAPTLSWNNLLDGTFGTELETYLSDHFPARDLFVGINAYYELATGRGGASDVYLGKDGYLIAAPSNGNAQHVQTNVSRFAAFAAANHCDATLMMVPTAGYIMKDKLPAVHQDYQDDLFFETAQAAAEGMAFVDIRNTLLQDAQNGSPLLPSAASSGQPYYKTDHHLTSEGAYLMYAAFCEQQEISPQTNYRIESAADFYGTAYSQSGYWLTAPDDIELWHNDDLQVTVEITENGAEPVISDSLFFRDRLEEADKYPVFLDGNHSLVKITNHNADGGKLLIVKDSFAHCFAGFLAQHYREIYMVDLRYYRSSVSELISQNSISDILYLYGVDNLSTESANSVWLE